MKVSKIRIALIFILVILLTASNTLASGKKLNASKLKSLFSQESNGDWNFTLTTNSSDCTTGLIIQLISEGDGTFQTGIYGYYYSFNDKAFLETTGYAFTIDGHKYSFQESPVQISFDTNLGRMKCAYVVHPLLNEMIKEMKNAKEVKVEIGFEMREFSGDSINVAYTYSGKDAGLTTLKSVANALISANYFDNLSQEPSVYEDMIVVTESYE